MRMVFDHNRNQDQRRSNAASANEVAIVNVGDEECTPGSRFFVIHEQTGHLHYINHLSKSCAVAYLGFGEGGANLDFSVSR